MWSETLQKRLALIIHFFKSSNEPGAAFFCLEPEPTQFGRSRSRLRGLVLPEPEPSKKVRAPQHCWQVTLLSWSMGIQNTAITRNKELADKLCSIIIIFFRLTTISGRMIFTVYREEEPALKRRLSAPTYPIPAQGRHKNAGLATLDSQFLTEHIFSSLFSF